MQRLPRRMTHARIRVAFVQMLKYLLYARVIGDERQNADSSCAFQRLGASQEAQAAQNVG